MSDKPTPEQLADWTRRLDALTGDGAQIDALFAAIFAAGHAAALKGARTEWGFENWVGDECSVRVEPRGRAQVLAKHWNKALVSRTVLPWYEAGDDEAQP